jgi:hypothetical protein
MAALSPEVRAVLVGVPELGGSAPADGQLRLHPERRLMVAVLHEALIDYERGVRGELMDEPWVFRRVVRWFRSDDTRWPCSFVNVCDALDLSPGAVRSTLRGPRAPAIGARTRRRGRAGWLGRR